MYRFRSSDVEHQRLLELLESDSKAETQETHPRQPDQKTVVLPDGTIARSEDALEAVRNAVRKERRGSRVIFFPGTTRISRIEGDMFSQLSGYIQDFRNWWSGTPQ